MSPDGQKVAVTLRDSAHGQNQDVWVLDASRGTGSRITAERTDEFNPAWFLDGERLVYVSDRVGFYDLYERPASGGAEKVLVQNNQDKVLPTVSTDGRNLLMNIPESGIFARVLAPLTERGDSLRLSGDSRFSEEHASISPDGRSTAFDRTPPIWITCDKIETPSSASNFFTTAPAATLAAVSLALARSSTSRASVKPYFCMPTRSAWPGRTWVRGWAVTPGAGDISACHLSLRNHSLFLISIATGEPNVRPWRTPPSNVSSSCSNFWRGPRP